MSRAEKKTKRRTYRTKQERIKRFVTIAFCTCVFTIQFTGLDLLFHVKPAFALTTLEIEPITWDFVGLDSNKPLTEGPNTYVVGARVCNIGNEDAVNVTTRFVKDGIDNGYTFIQLQASDTYEFPLIKANLPANEVNGRRTTGQLGYVFDNSDNVTTAKTKYTIDYTPANCQDFYYNFEAVRNSAAHDTYQKYYIEATADNAPGFVTTPRPRQIYIEKIISQSRNYVYSFTCDNGSGTPQSGSVNVEVGQTFTCTALASTATAYPQDSFTADIPNVIFQVLDVSTTYSNPAGGKNSTVYADGCGWIQDPTDPRYHRSSSNCVGEDLVNGNSYRDQYPFNDDKGAVGNSISTTYTIEVLDHPDNANITNPITVSNIILDYSGSSYHYNADYGAAPNIININVGFPAATDLSVDKNHSGDFSYGTNSYTLTVNDALDAGDAKAPVILTDTLPTGYTFNSFGTDNDEADWSCSVFEQTIACAYDPNGDGIPDDFPNGGSNTLILNVDVANTLASGTTSTNFVEVESNENQTDTNPSNNLDSDPTTVLAIPNITLAKTSTPANPAQFEVGTAMASYTLTADNSTTFDIDGPLTIVDTLPTGITFNNQSSAPTDAGWSCNATDATNQTVICTNSSGLTSGSNTQVTFAVDVSAAAIDIDTVTEGVQVVNTAVISTGSQETSLSDNTATITNQVNKPVPDLSILKTDGNVDFEDNGTGFYFITVTNIGSIPTDEVLTITDSLPEIFNTNNVSEGFLTFQEAIDPATGVTSTDWSCSAASPALTDITCTSTPGFSLSPGQNTTLRFEVNVPNLGNNPGTFNPVTNTANIAPVAEEIITSNNQSSDNTDIVGNVTGNESDIKVTKSVSVTPAGPGDTITYELLIANDDSNQDISNGNFEDLVPSQISNVTATCSVASGTATCCDISQSTDTNGITAVTCDTTDATNPFITLAKKQGQNESAVTITISGTADASGDIYNGASVEIDPSDVVQDNDPTNNFSSVTTSVPSPTLTIDKTPIPATFTQGSLVTYRLTVTNPGAPNTLNSAGFLRIDDPLPAQYTYVSSSSAPSSSGWSCTANGQNVTCLNGDTVLAPGASTAVDLLLRVSGNGTNIDNVATLTRPDGTTAIDNDVQNNIVAAIPDLAISKSAANIASSQEGTYTLQVANVGSGNAAAPIIVRDTLPSGLTYLSSTGSGWNCSTQTTPTVDPQTVICTSYNDIAATTSAPDLVLNVRVSGSASGSLTNTAQVNLAPDATILGEVVTGNNTDTIVTPIVSASDLGIIKTATDQDASTSGIQVTENSPATYTIVVTNNGASNYSGSIVIDENLPMQLGYLSHSDSSEWVCESGGSPCAQGNQALTFTKAGGLFAGQSSTFTLEVQVADTTQGTTIDNTASINAATLTNANDPTGDSNDSDTETVNVIDDLSALVLEKDDNDGESPDEPTAAISQTKFPQGGEGRYTILVTNNGPAAAKLPVQITEPSGFPSGMTYREASLTSDWRCTGTVGGDGSDLVCTYGSWNDDFTIFTETDLPSGISSGVEIVVDVNVPNPGSIATLSGGVYTNLVTNTARVVSANNTTGTTATESTAVILPADLAIAKAINTSPLSLSGTGTYTLTITNNGPGDSEADIYVTDYLPDSLSYTGPASGTLLTGGNNDSTWTVVSYNDSANEVTFRRSSTLSASATTQIDVPISVSSSAPGSVRNFVRVNGFTPEPDYDVTNNDPINTYDDPNNAVCDRSFASQPVNNCFVLETPITGGEAVDLSVEKRHQTNDVVDAAAYDTDFTYVIDVTNNSSTTTAEGVTLEDPLPTSLTTSNANISFIAGETITPNPFTGMDSLNRSCSYDSLSNRILCSLFNVAANETISIQVIARSKVSGVIPNTATVTSNTNDSDLSNNSEDESVRIATTTGVNTISGNVFIDSNDNGIKDTGETGYTGQNVTVNLYQDNGDTSGAVDSNDVLISTATTDANGDYSFAVGITGDFVMAIAAPPSGTTITPTASPSNVETASFDAVPDTPNSDINNDFGITNPVTTTADLELTKEVNSVIPSVGSNVVYTVTVTNNGPDDATNVQVTDQLPADVTYVSDDSGGAYVSSSGIWTVGTLNNGQSATLNITATVDTAGTKTNTAEVTASDQSDPDSIPSNNVSNEDDQDSVDIDGLNTGPAFLCTTDLYLMQDPDPPGDSALFSINRTSNPYTLSNIGSSSGVEYNALGFNPVDGYMYGILNNNSGTIYRIDSNGDINSLGTPSGWQTSWGSGWFSGTFLEDGTYVVNSNGLTGNRRLVVIDLEKMEVKSNLLLPTIYNTIFDIAVNPLDGQIYGYNEGNGGRLVRIDPNNLSSITEVSTNSQSGVTARIASVFFDSFGRLFLYGSTSTDNTDFSRFFIADTNTGVLTEVSEGQAVVRSDGATCGFGVDLQKTVAPDPAPIGSTVTYTYTLTNQSNVPVTTNFVDDMDDNNNPGTVDANERRYVAGTLTNSFGGTPNSFADSDQLSISGLTIPADTIATLTIDVFIPNEPSLGGTTVFNQACLENTTSSSVVGYPAQICSDDGDVTTTPDETPLDLTSPTSTEADLLLVKRISAVRRGGAILGQGDRPGGQDTSIFNDDTSSTDDNDANWPTATDTYLKGALTGGEIQPGDEIEYTIYFLNSGDSAANNVTICDVVPDNMSYVQSSMELFFDNTLPISDPVSPDPEVLLGALGTAPDTLTDEPNDGDRGAYYPPGVAPSPAGLCKRGGTTDIDGTNNDTGSVVFKVVDGTTTPDNIAPATSAGDPANSYGFIRFRATTE